MVEKALRRAPRARARHWPGRVEVGDPEVSVGGHHDVRGLDVAVDHAALVDLCERRGDPRTDPATLRLAEPTPLRQHVSEAAVAGDRLHDRRVAAAVRRVRCGDHAGTLNQTQDSALKGGPADRRHFPMLR